MPSGEEDSPPEDEMPLSSPPPKNLLGDVTDPPAPAQPRPPRTADAGILDPALNRGPLPLRA
eukprot:CAMPEP_0194337720 /NCGR_PEP_ID=MMETSP0171-20130528/77192_1 /TAXON_ID=218684 /ORGANISM="Corethron pennatum, Strain L29A3" /LENGTH=61 /DNA_ID=CAMNT_0039101597 /DNA_START=285 /DNA_END=467 /DNA_ORIENTATION=-